MADTPQPSTTARIGGRAASLASGIMGTVHRLSLIGGAAAIWLWIWLFLPFGPTAWAVAWRAAVLALLLAPGTLLFLAWLGLREVASLPDRVRETVAGGREQAAAVRDHFTALGPAGRGPRRVARTLWEIWGLLSESRDLVFGSVALARMANPVTAIIIIGATGLTLAIVGLSGLALLATFVTGRLGW